MPGASSPPAGAAARAASAFGCTSTSPTRCSSFNPVALSTITSWRLPACVGFTSTPKIPGRDGASTRNTSGCAEPAFKANLHIAFSERLEAIQAREMNGES